MDVDPEEPGRSEESGGVRGGQGLNGRFWESGVSDISQGESKGSEWSQGESGGSEEVLSLIHI